MCSSLLKISLIISWVSMSISHSALRVIGGKDADEDKYAYVVRLQNLYTLFVLNLTLSFHVCTGALITPTWTVTAAHCVKSKEITKTSSLIPYIRVGRVDDVVSKFNEAIKFIKKGIKHPSYVLNTYRLRNDIGLVKSEAISLMRYGRLSAIDDLTLIGLEATVTGYGVTNVSWHVGDATALEKPLQILDVIVVDCMEKIRMQVSPRLCVARRCGRSAGLCPGDSGGPLLHSSGILGVNSCGPQSLPTFCFLKPNAPVYDTGVITPIFPFIDWIKSTLEQDSLSPDT